MGDGRINEARLRHVYETLSTRLPQDALNLCDKYIKKDPHSNALLAVRAFVLLHCGRVEEACALAETVAASNSTDLEVIETLDRIYVALERPEKSAALFERACKATAWHETYASLWFTGLVRILDYRSMLSLSLKMQNFTKKEQYSFWAMSSLLLHVDSTTDDLEKKRLLRLLESMLVKLNTTNPSFVNNHEELLFAVDLCRKTENYALALDIFLRAAPDTFSDASQRLALHLTLLKHSGQIDAASTLACSEMHFNGILDWATWETFLQCCVSDTSATCSEKYQSVTKLLSSIAGKGDVRNHMLAGITASIQLSPDSEEFIAGMSAFVEQYHEHGCCTDDMCHVVRSRLSRDQSLKLLDFACVRASSNQSCSRIWIHVARTIVHCHNFYIHPKYEASTAQFMSNDPQTSDDSAVLTALLHLDAGRLDDCIECLQKILPCNPDNFVAKLILICAYRMAGAIFAARDVYFALSIKELQLDTLSYILVDDLVDFGAEKDASDISNDALSFYDDSRAQSWRLIVEAFRAGRYSSICNFAEFNRRLDNSIQELAFIVASIRSEMFSKSVNGTLKLIASLNPSELLIDAKQFSSLADNRDKDVFDFCDPSGRLRNAHLPPSFNAIDLAFYGTAFFALHLLSVGVNERSQIISLLRRSSSSLLELAQHSALDGHLKGQYDFAHCIMNVIVPCISIDSATNPLDIGVALASAAEILQWNFVDSPLSIAIARNALMEAYSFLFKLRFLWLAYVAANDNANIPTDNIIGIITERIASVMRQLTFWASHMNSSSEDTLVKSWRATVKCFISHAERLLK